MTDSKSRVDFGYEKVSPEEKTRRVGGVFTSVADRYDVMNDLMSFGTHRLMKRMLIEMSGLRAGDTHLDLAGGTGDIAALASPIVGAEGQVVLADINAEMLDVGRARLLDKGITNARACQANAEHLPFEDASFDCLTIGLACAMSLTKIRRCARCVAYCAPAASCWCSNFLTSKTHYCARRIRAFKRSGRLPAKRW